jgi:protein O-GlcNAc transferase
MDQSNSTEGASSLLIACAKVETSAEDEATIRHILNGAVDWTGFAQQAIDRELTSLAGGTLLRVAPDLLPADIAAAFTAIVDQTRQKNDRLLDKLTSLAEHPNTVRAIKDAYTAARRALLENPNNPSAWAKLGKALYDSKRVEEAVICYVYATRCAPNESSIWRDCGIALKSLQRNEAALTYLDKALALDPKDALAWTFRAHALTALERIAEAVEASDQALALDPASVSASRVNTHALLFSCDWRRRGDLMRRVRDGVAAGHAIITPFNHLAISDSEEENLKVAKIWARGVPPASPPLWRDERYSHDRIRIAYISTDFRDTLAINAIGGGFEAHDRSRFEMTAISLSPSDGSDTRRRIEATFHNFVDATKMEDRDVAKLLRDNEIDLAIDLNGYAGAKRPQILAHRPAPIQVIYLGYAGTMAMPFFDYIIADATVIPPEHHRYYSEKVVYLPHTFFPIDRKRQIATEMPKRAELGLPEKSFVFTCQNTVYKISPEIFDVWMRVLRAVEDSVIWFGVADALASDNLRREALARGIAPERLIFSSWVARRADHLARLRLADLFLDTRPYNAHTTASDALWAGLPLLTCAGDTFPARVAGSLLDAAGVPELVTSSLQEYERTAVELANDRVRLAAIRSKLARNRDVEPLFDTLRFTRHLEAAYIKMWERQQAGLPPAHFAVAPLR